MSTPRSEAREIQDFVAEYAARRGLNEAQQDVLVDKTAAIVDWLKAFRRCLGYAKRYGATHPSRLETLRAFVAETQQLQSVHGAIVLRFTSERSTTEEGFGLPHAAESDLDAYTFFPFFRDGVSTLTLKRGVGASELNAMMDIIVTNGRRPGDDVVTWLWSARYPTLRVAVEPTFSPMVAASVISTLHHDAPLEAYVTTLRAVAPFEPPSDPRAPVRVEDHDAMRAQGIDPDAIAARLAAGYAALAAALAPDALATFRERFRDDRDREGRVARMGLPNEENV